MNLKTILIPVKVKAIPLLEFSSQFLKPSGRNMECVAFCSDRFKCLQSEKLNCLFICGFKELVFVLLKDLSTEYLLFYCLIGT